MKIYLTYRERVAGFFILISLVLVTLFVVGAAVENLWFTPKTKYHIYVVRGDGLRKGSPVLLSGVEVGKVGEMTIMKDGRIDAVLSVLTSHSQRITVGTQAEIRRALGIGEKRVLLTLATDKRMATQLPPEAVIPVNEPRDLLDVVSTIDLGMYMETMDRTVKSLDLLMKKLDEEDRLVRMLEAFYKLGPTLDIMNKFFTDIDGPFLALIENPDIPKAFKSGNRIFADKKTRKLIHTLADSMEPERVQKLIGQSETLITRLDAMLTPGSHMQNTFKGTDKLLNDGKLDRMLTSMENLTDEEQIERLLKNMTILSSQMAKIGPEIPGMAKELESTMKELSIVLKALQKTWLLDDETEEVLKKMKKQK